MARGEPISDMILNRVFSNCPEEIPNRSQTVLSCGGIYIPHKGTGSRIIHQILNMPRTDEPVKLVSTNAPRNILREVLLKESLN